MSQRITEEELKLEVSNLRKEVLALKQSEKASKIDLAEMNQIFQTVADGVIVIDKVFNVVRVNETFTVLSGFNEQESIGRKCYEIFPDSLCHTPGCPMARISCCVERIEYEAYKQRRNGTRIPCIVTATPLRGLTENCSALWRILGISPGLNEYRRIFIRVLKNLENPWEELSRQFPLPLKKGILIRPDISAVLQSSAEP